MPSNRSPMMFLKSFCPKMFVNPFFYTNLMYYICSHENIRWAERVNVVLNDTCEHHKSLIIQFFRTVCSTLFNIFFFLKPSNNIWLSVHTIMNWPIFPWLSLFFYNLMVWQKVNNSQNSSYFCSFNHRKVKIIIGKFQLQILNLFLDSQISIFVLKLLILYVFYV